MKHTLTSVSLLVPLVTAGCTVGAIDTTQYCIRTEASALAPEMPVAYWKT